MREFSNGTFLKNCQPLTADHAAEKGKASVVKSALLQQDTEAEASGNQKCTTQQDTEAEASGNTSEVNPHLLTTRD